MSNGAKGPVTDATGKIVKRTDAFASVQTMMNNLLGQVKVAAPAHMRPEKLIRVFLTECQRIPGLLACTRESLLGGFFTAAQLGLEIGSHAGQSYLIPFRDKKSGRTIATFVLGYRGAVALMYRHPRVSSIIADWVVEGDEFLFRRGIERDEFRHVGGPDAAEKRAHRAVTDAPLTHAYAIARLKDGGAIAAVMSRAEVEVIRARARAGRDGPWLTDYPQMALKTALKQLYRTAPVLIEAAEAFALDDAADRGETQVFDLPEAARAAAAADVTPPEPNGAGPGDEVPPPGDGDGPPVDPETGEVGPVPQAGPPTDKQRKAWHALERDCGRADSTFEPKPHRVEVLGTEKVETAAQASRLIDALRTKAQEVGAA